MIRYSDFGIDPKNPNLDGSDFHLMNLIDDANKVERRRRMNWFIILGVIVVLDIAFVATAGEFLAQSPIVKTMCGRL